MKRLVIAFIVLILAAAGAGPQARAGTPEEAAAGPLEKAVALWRQGYVLHMMGAYPEAIDLSGRSIGLDRKSVV